MASEMEVLVTGITDLDKPFTKIHWGDRAWVPLLEVSEYIDAVTERVRRLLPLLEASILMADAKTSQQFHLAVELWDRELAAAKKG